MLALVHMSEFAQRKPRQLFRRPATAHRTGALPRHRSESAAARRAVRRARQELAARHADRGQALAARVRRDHDSRHARPGRSIVDGRSHRRDVARQIEQVSTPTEIYDLPRTLFVNQFVGTTNVLPGEFFNAGAGAQVRLPRRRRHRCAEGAGLHRWQQGCGVDPARAVARRAGRRAWAAGHRQGGDAAWRACRPTRSKSAPACRSR